MCSSWRYFRMTHRLIINYRLAHHKTVTSRLKPATGSTVHRSHAIKEVQVVPGPHDLSMRPVSPIKDQMRPPGSMLELSGTRQGLRVHRTRRGWEAEKVS